MPSRRSARMEQRSAPWAGGGPPRLAIHAAAMVAIAAIAGEHDRRERGGRGSAGIRIGGKVGHRGVAVKPVVRPGGGFSGRRRPRASGAGDDSDLYDRDTSERRCRGHRRAAGSRGRRTDGGPFSLEVRPLMAGGSTAPGGEHRHPTLRGPRSSMPLLVLRHQHLRDRPQASRRKARLATPSGRVDCRSRPRSTPNPRTFAAAGAGVAPGRVPVRSRHGLALVPTEDEAELRDSHVLLRPGGATTVRPELVAIADRFGSRAAELFRQLQQIKSARRRTDELLKGGSRASS